MKIRFQNKCFYFYFQKKNQHGLRILMVTLEEVERRVEFKLTIKKKYRNYDFLLENDV